MVRAVSVVNAVALIVVTVYAVHLHQTRGEAQSAVRLLMDLRSIERTGVCGRDA